MPPYSAIADYPLDPSEEAAVATFANRARPKPPPFATRTLTAAGFRWRKARSALLGAFAVTGLCVPLGVYGLFHVWRVTDSAGAFGEKLAAEKAHWAAAGLLGLHSAVALLAFAVQGGFRSVAFAGSPMSLEAADDGLSIMTGGTRISGAWTNWRLGPLVTSPVPEQYPEVVLDAFWLTNYDPATRENRGSVLITPDELANGEKVCAWLIHEMMAHHGGDSR